MGPKNDDRANKGSTNLIRCYRTDDLAIMEAYIRLVLGVHIFIFLKHIQHNVWKCFQFFLSHINTMDQKVNHLHGRPKREDEGSYK